MPKWINCDYSVIVVYNYVVVRDTNSIASLSCQGCYSKMKNWFEDNLLNTGIGVIVVCSIEV